jgi:hypothetical protein
MKKATKDVNDVAQAHKESVEVDLTEETESNDDIQQAIWEIMKDAMRDL